MRRHLLVMSSISSQSSAGPFLRSRYSRFRPRLPQLLPAAAARCPVPKPLLARAATNEGSHRGHAGRRGQDTSATAVASESVAAVVAQAPRTAAITARRALRHKINIRRTRAQRRRFKLAAIGNHWQRVRQWSAAMLPQWHSQMASMHTRVRTLGGPRPAAPPLL
jgi:hypothetical protein